MNIKKIVSKVVALGLLVGLASTSAMPGVQAKAAEETAKEWNTLILVCPRVDIPKGPYNANAVTQMYDTEVNKIKTDASAVEEFVNGGSMGRANMKVDVVVSETPITSMSLSMAYGHFISSSNVGDILDKYAPQGKYDSVVLVYRDKDYSISLNTSNVSEFGRVYDGVSSTNGATFSTVALKDSDHSMVFEDPNYPMYLIEPLTQGLYRYYSDYGYDLDYPEMIYDGFSDHYQFNKAKRAYFRSYLSGMKWSENSKAGITEEMWKELPTSKLNI